MVCRNLETGGLERDKEKLLDDIERRLTADIRREPLFTLRWRLV
jgi:hypothetical protein